MPRFEEIKIQSGKAVTYFDYGKDLFYPSKSMWTEGEIVDNTIKGKFSKKSKKRFSEIIKNWISVIDADICKQTANGKRYADYLVFITLTLSSAQFHDDKFIKRHMLNDFIRTIKIKHNVKSYIYCSEAQSNGNIHFHIVTDKKINHVIIRKIWNRIQEAHGYISRFENKHGHRNPNSTDIHSFRKIKSVAAYLIKYFTKDESRRLIEGRLWGCSDNLRMLEPFRTEVSSGIAQILNRICETKNSFVFRSDHFTMFKQISFKEIEKINKEIYNEIITFYTNQLRYL